MSTPILSTKLHIPSPRSITVSRPRLTERLDEGASGKLTLVSAPAGSGKTTLVGEWLAARPMRAAWLSLDEGDNDPIRFLNGLIAAWRTLAPNFGEGAAGLLRSLQPPPIESVMTALINELDAIEGRTVLVLDDYHVIQSARIDSALALLIERMPPQLNLVVVTREDPRLPLARLRVRDRLVEVRSADLRFTSAESADFLDRVMGLNLSPDQAALLEARTEGWIAGLQLAALSLQGRRDPAGFIRSFAGSHPFVLDYMVEEVLQRQSDAIQSFLLRTSILDRMCGPLCDAVVGEAAGEQPAPFPSSSGQLVLERLERSNLFIIPLDDERRWYRYHHLFAELLRKRLRESLYSESGNGGSGEDRLHMRASKWYEDHGLDLEAFRHAVAARDTRSAARLSEGNGMPLLFRGAVAPVRSWLDSLPAGELDAMPSLWVMYASALLMAGQMAGVEPKLQAAEKAMQGAEPDAAARDIIGHIASIRATLAVSTHQADTIVAEARRALDYLHPDNLPVRTATAWTLGYAYQLRGDRDAAGKLYTEALSNSQKIGHIVIAVMSALGLGNIHEAETRLYSAAETYRRVLEMAGNPPLPAACEAYLGLARISYEWNDPDAALQHGLQAVRLAKQFEHTDRAVAAELFIARLKLGRGELSEAAELLSDIELIARRHQFVHQFSTIADARVHVLLAQGNRKAAADLAMKHELPFSQVRVHLAHGNASAALSELAPLQQRANTRGLQDERLKAAVLQAIALQAHGDKIKALQLLADALAMAEPGGFVRTFVDEGSPMHRLLCEAYARKMMPDYIRKLLAAFQSEETTAETEADPAPNRTGVPLIEPLSGRELEVLRLIAQGLSNREIGDRLFIALATVKGHNRIIFDKLQVKRRTEAVARARGLGLL